MLSEWRVTLIGVGADGESVLVVGEDDFAFDGVDVDVMFLHLM